jgi:23S rRNA (cytosine1962-C5)-methyltransferase
MRNLSQLESKLQSFSMEASFMSGAPSKSRLRLRISPAAERVLRAGHPWIFADSIREQNRAGSSGELAIIYDRQDRFLAVGLFDAESPIRFRALQSRQPETIDHDWWVCRLKESVARRERLFDHHTTGYRLINGESDGWPGLVLDRYADTLVLKLYTQAWLPRLVEIVDIVKTELRPERIVLRLSRNVAAIVWDQFHREDGSMLHGAVLEPEGVAQFRESGLVFEADVVRGQKTGFFLDQRENRRKIETLAAGRTVLNAFSFSGGFSVYAARGGANSVTDIDISNHALASAQRNLKLNLADPKVAAARHESIQADAFEWLAGNSQKIFDLVILDPPSLAKRETERAGAIQAYEKLIASGINHLRPGGILLACSCSAHVTTGEFFQAARDAARKSRRPHRVFLENGHPLDHPARFKEAEYLKAIYFAFEAGD